MKSFIHALRVYLRVRASTLCLSPKKKKRRKDESKKKNSKNHVKRAVDRGSFSLNSLVPRSLVMTILTQVTSPRRSPASNCIVLARFSVRHAGELTPPPPDNKIPFVKVELRQLFPVEDGWPSLSLSTSPFHFILFLSLSLVHQLTRNSLLENFARWTLARASDPVSLTVDSLTAMFNLSRTVCFLALDETTKTVPMYYYVRCYETLIVELSLISCKTFSTIIMGCI